MRTFILTPVPHVAATEDTMKRFLLAAALALTATAAYAQCVTNTYIINGRMTTCVTCCTFGNCTTTCI